jgi:arylsulfatase A-like enzyme
MIRIVNRQVTLNFSLLVLALNFAIAITNGQELKTDQPNIIIILVDDMGYDDVGFNGCTDIPTPNIDRVAKNGIKFTNGYVSYAVCGPSRAGLITGRYQDRFGFGRNPLLAPNDPNMGLPLTEETLATVLDRGGYNSLAIGKWHLGAHENLHPLKRGFDEFYGFLSGGHRYFPEEWTLEDLSEIKSQNDGYRTKLMRDYKRVDEKEYLTDALAREAIEFVDRSTDEPFFIYLAYNAPHSPLQATEKYLSRFDHIENKKRKTYAAMVSAVDDGVGGLLDKLKEKGIEENTMVFFLSDNGGPEQRNASDNGALRGGKGDYYEGGIRVPFAMQWPSKIKAGQVYEHPIISLDIFATASAYANVTLNPERPLDGVNLIPFVTEKKEGIPHEYLFWRNFDKPSSAVRSGNFKYVIPKSQEKSLFDVSSDIGEIKNLREVELDQFKNLERKWINWQKEMKEPRFLGLLLGKEYDMSHPDRYKLKKGW